MKKTILSMTITMMVVLAFTFTAIAGGTHAAPVMSSAQSAGVTKEGTQSAQQDTTAPVVKKEAAAEKKETVTKEKTNPKKTSSKGSKYAKKHSLKSKKAVKKSDGTAKSPEGK